MIHFSVTLQKKEKVMRSRKACLGGLVCIVVIAVFFGFAFNPTVAVAEEKLTIGIIGTLSGGGAAWGLAFKYGAELAIDKVNARGGLKAGGKTYKLSSIAYDDQYTGQGGTTAANRLINEDKVPFILGPIGSPACVGAGIVANREKTLILSDGFSPRILGPDKPYTFRIANTTNEFAPPIAKWVAKTFPKMKKVALVTPQDEVGQAVAPLNIRCYKAAGFEVIASDHFERGIKDFVPLLNRVLRKGPDVIELDGTAPGDAGLIVKQARQLGYKNLIVQTGGPGIEQVMNVAGKLAEGFLSYNIFDPDDPNPEVQAFIKAFKKKGYPGVINPYCPVMYNAAMMFFDTIEKANTLDTEKLKAALEKTDGYETMFGPIRWTGVETYGIRHQILTPFYISEVKNGKIVTYDKIIPQP
jgi:branched-chain amino acid transport system substrate-binding protein